MTLSAAEQRARIQLHLAWGSSATRLWSWLAKAGSAEALLAAGADGIAAMGAPAEVADALVAPRAREAADREMELARSRGAGFLFPEAEPADANDLGPIAAFRCIEAPPLAVAWWGRLELLSPLRSRVAIVGTRTPTPYGAQQARRFAGGLAAGGVVIVSGFARGIDREGHCAALEAGGDTIAVLGSGLMTPYPKDQPALLRQIAARGLVISQFPMEMEPSKANFPRRNRILSGISDAVVVIEAGSASGSLITARFAVDQGKSVFAVPGRVDSPMSRGCNEILAAASAAVATSPRDVLAELAAIGIGGVEEPIPAERGASAGGSAGGSPFGLDSTKRKIWEAAREGASLEELQSASEASDDDLFDGITALELAGLLDRAPGGLYRAVEARAPP